MKVQKQYAKLKTKLELFLISFYLFLSHVLRHLFFSTKVVHSVLLKTFLESSFANFLANHIS